MKLWFLLAFACFAQSLAIHMQDGVFRVSGFTPGAEPADGWCSLLHVYAGDGDVPPMMGSCSVESGTLTFRPRFPLTPGLKVRATFQPPQGLVAVQYFDVPRREMPATTRLAHVYPSANRLPQNQLKFYLYFSAPMAKGEAWKHIRLLSQNGVPVDLPFLEIDQELWDPDMRRLTVLFDPGRIKRGVLPLEQVGPAIEAGKSYTLVIDRSWPDGSRAPLVETYRKTFSVGPPDRTPPDPAQWHITAPRAGTTESLAVDFPEPLDYALLGHSIVVESPAETVPGTVSVEHEEMRWRFTPQQPWKAGSYKLVIAATLEDLAGNHILRAFDVDTFEKVTRQIPKETISLPFRIGRQ